MKLTYTTKRWLPSPVKVAVLIRRLGFRLLASLDRDNWLVKRRGSKGPSFHVLHRSWGDGDLVSKYKLFHAKD